MIFGVLRQLVHWRPIGSGLDSIGPDLPRQIHEDERQSVGHALLRDFADLFVAEGGLRLGGRDHEQGKRDQTEVKSKSFRRASAACHSKFLVHNRLFA